MVARLLTFDEAKGESSVVVEQLKKDVLTVTMKAGGTDQYSNSVVRAGMERGKCNDEREDRGDAGVR